MSNLLFLFFYCRLCREFFSPVSKWNGFECNKEVTRLKGEDEVLILKSMSGLGTANISDHSVG